MVQKTKHGSPESVREQRELEEVVRRPLSPQLGMEEPPPDAGEDGATGHYTHSAPLASWVLLEHYIKDK